jgi:hypothetical protein
MTRDTLQAAIQEAERFLEKAKKVEFEPTGRWISGTYTASAACKRASMDLTKALSTLRRP